MSKQQRIEDIILAIAKRYVYVGPIVFVLVCLYLLGLKFACLFFGIAGLIYWIADSL